MTTLFNTFKMMTTTLSANKTQEDHQKMTKNEPPKYKSWAQMSFEGDDEEEDEEELERKRIAEETIKNNIACRRFLYNLGLYELEEGEILE